jgi:hypothetical protein
MENDPFKKLREVPKDPSLIVEAALIAELDGEGIPGDLTREIDGSFVIYVDALHNKKVLEIFKSFEELKEYYGSLDYDWLDNLQFHQSINYGSVFYYNPDGINVDND